MGFIANSNNTKLPSFKGNIVGTFVVDWNLYTNFDLTAIGSVTITEEGIPPVGFEQTGTVHLTGDEAITIPVGWSIVGGGTYDGINGSLYVVQNWDSNKNHTVINTKV